MPGCGGVTAIGIAASSYLVAASCQKVAATFLGSKKTFLLPLLLAEHS